MSALRMTVQQVQHTSAVSGQVDFVAGAITGKRGTGTAGRLEGEARKMYSEGYREDTIIYVVSSYATPIAWYDTNLGWVMPEAKYSPTTSHHQNMVLLALRGEDIRLV